MKTPPVVLKRRESESERIAREKEQSFSTKSTTADAEEAEDSPVKQFFYENYKLGDDRDRTRAWLRRVMEYWR